MSFVINGHQYSGNPGDGYKEAAKDLAAKGEHIDPFNSYVDPTNEEYIQRELDKLDYAHKPLW